MFLLIFKNNVFCLIDIRAYRTCEQTGNWANWTNYDDCLKIYTPRVSKNRIDTISIVLMFLFLFKDVYTFGKFIRIKICWTTNLIKT